jgi:hypothetical protein
MPPDGGPAPRQVCSVQGQAGPLKQRLALLQVPRPALPPPRPARSHNPPTPPHRLYLSPARPPALP